jgi:hypothetical protein
MRMANPRCLACGDGGMEPYQENSFCVHKNGIKEICVPYYCDNCESWTMVWTATKPKRELNKLYLKDPKVIKRFIKGTI